MDGRAEWMLEVNSYFWEKISQADAIGRNSTLISNDLR